MKRLYDLLIGALCLVTASAASAQTVPFVLKQVGPGVYAAIDGPEHKSGSNAGFVIGDDGVLVVDAFLTPTLPGRSSVRSAGSLRGPSVMS